MNTANIVNVLMTAEGIKPLGERLGDGMQVFVIGILAVFGVLASLMGVLALFKIFFYEIPEKKKAEAKKKAENTQPAPVLPDTAETSVPVQEDDAQLIAVITAAIAAYTAESGKSALPFRVVSYKRVRGAGGWNGANENETF